MAIPTRYRSVLDEICAGELVITIDMKSTCLTLSPLPEWKKFEEKVAALPALDELAEMLSRFVVGQAKDLQVDGSGRVLIPPELRGYAQLEKKLVLSAVPSALRYGLKKIGMPSAKSRRKLTGVCFSIETICRMH